MRVTLLTAGTRGDSQAMSVLGHELRKRGHEIRLASSPGTHAIARAFAIAPMRLGPDMRSILSSGIDSRLTTVQHPWCVAREALAAVYSGTSLIDDMHAACEGASVVVASTETQHVAAVFAAKEMIPLVGLHLAPNRHTRAFPHPLATTRQLPGTLNSLSGIIMQFLMTQEMRPYVQSARRKVQLPNRVRAWPVFAEIQAYDSILFPHLKSTAYRPIVGAMEVPGEFRDALGDTASARALDRWLADGEPPVLFGFGSMPIADPSAMTKLITRVAAALGVRALISAGWTDLGALDSENPNVLLVGSIDHEIIMPRCPAVVHHGGAGTVAASVRAGVPTVVCSVLHDQSFWGTQIARSGMGTTLRFPELSFRALLGALEAVLSPEVRRRARELSAQVQRDCAAAKAADIIEGAVDREEIVKRGSRSRGRRSCE